MPFRKLLVANRGEIAVRVLRACHELGVETVAVASEADAEAPHAVLAGELRVIGGPRASESYLNLDAILEVARETGAEAIHPGYGFFAENPEAARRIEREGFTFVGPSAEVIALMGDKADARRAAREAGLPVAPGSEPLSDPAEIRAAAAELGLPVVVKPVGGGGGIGMSIVRDRDELERAIGSAQRLAQMAFGNASVYLEPYLERARHVEIQLAADAHGSVVHLGERECSVQRRYQKVIEESPSPGLDGELRAQIAGAAVELAAAVGYTSVGTVEFLVTPGGEFWFMEMNTRIQVEHPVTELTTGVDLVREQIRIAAGQPLSVAQEEVAHRGHAFQFRIYAEDFERNFMPSPGTIEALELPAGPGVRVDTGVRAGSAVTVHYDPLLLKVVVWDRDREHALARARRALRDLRVEGVKTTRDLHLLALETSELRSGEVHTRILEDEWLPRFKEARR